MQMNQDDKCLGSKKWASRVKFCVALEDVRDLIANDVAQNSPEYSRDHAHERCDKQRQIHLQGIGCSQDTEESKPKGIRDEQQSAWNIIDQVKRKNRHNECGNW